MAQRVVSEEMRFYYERRAREYDDWWLGEGRFSTRYRPGWHEEVAALTATVRALAPVPTLEVASVSRPANRSSATRAPNRLAPTPRPVWPTV